MKKLNKVSMIALAALLASALAIPFVLGQGAGRPQDNQQEERFERRGFGRPGGRGMHDRLFSRLNLTDAQKEQFKQLNQGFFERTKSLRDELRAKRQELRQLNTGETFNEAQATQKLTEIAALDAKMMGEQFKLRQEVSKILTAEQKAQLEQMREQMKTKREGFKSRRGERRDNQGQ
jgi:Spy/CpxP family protein refolding chaperone